MALSIWRYSHFILAVSTALFLILASVSGVILAFQPISQASKSYVVSNLEDISLDQTLSVLQKEYNEILELEVTPSNGLKTSIINEKGDHLEFYINPLTAKKIGDIEKVSPIFKWTTNLHRSLFLKSTGRFFVGLVSFLLCIIAITGLVLVIKRQGGVLKLFSAVKETSFNERYHVIFGRLFLIPMLIIAGTGVYLSAEKFSLLPKHTIQHNYNTIFQSTIENSSISEFSIFKNTKLNNLRKLTFPFSNDAEDYFEVSLKNKEVLVHQYTAEIISEVSYPMIQMASQFSLKLHTGYGSVIWSFVLLLSSLSILFFIYSGIKISVKRIFKSRINFKDIDKDECDIVLLVGSETGNTFVFAKDFCKSLIKAGKKVFLSSLNEYTTYAKASQIIVFTATYGDGDAPSNAKHFEGVFKALSPINKMQFSVVGFGSKLYDKYCHYAVKADALFHKSTDFQPLLPLVKINDQSQSAFNTWVAQWSKSTKIPLQFKIGEERRRKSKFTVVKRTDLDSDHTFILELEPKENSSFQSGDLLSIAPEYDKKERLYSIASIGTRIVLSIKKHNMGICSLQLSALRCNDTITASIKQNPGFHLPKEAKEVILIANGTGIAPFLGMLNEEKSVKPKTYLFWGGRTQQSFKTYEDLINKAFRAQNLSGLFLNFSKEENQRKYVQDGLIERKDLVSKVLKSGGTVMICGSLVMKNGVLKALDQISKEKLDLAVDVLEMKGQILTDCY